MNCILFSRVSTLVQDLTQQTNELISEAERLGYSKEQQILIEYKESAIKLSIDERKGIIALKESIEQNPVDCVIVYEISRISRQTTMLYEIRDWLIQRNIQLICLKPYMRLLEDGKMSQTANILFSLFASLSEGEMIVKKERMLRGKQHKIDNNQYIDSYILFGYKVGKNREIEIDYNEADVVRKIFMWYGEGRSLIWIARELHQRGIVAHRWTTENSIICSIKNIMRRKEYIGEKHRYIFPRIISDELFNVVQEKITKNKCKYRTHKEYLGQGLLRDSETGFVMSPNAHVYAWYRNGVSGKFTVSTRVIEKWLWELCEPRARQASKENNMKTFQHDTYVLNSKIHNIKMQRDMLNNKIAKINKRIVDGKLDEQLGDKMLEDVYQEINELDNMNTMLVDKLSRLRPNEVDLSDKKSVVRNEIEYINVENQGKVDKTNIRKLEVHFRDGSIQEFTYKSKSTKAWIEITE